MSDITTFDLQKVMIRAYQDPGITSAFVEMLYDYLNQTTGVIKIKYEDASKYIDITTTKVDSLMFTAAIKELFSRFVMNVLNTPDLEYILSTDPNYYKIKKLREPDILYLAVGAVSVLDLSMNKETSIFRINLIN